LKTNSCITPKEKEKKTVKCVTILTSDLLKFVNTYPSLTKNSYADIQRLNLQLEHRTTLGHIVYLPGTSQKSNVGDNRLICEVTLSLGPLSPPIPSFSGIHKVRKFLLNLRYQYLAGRFQKSIQDQHWKIQDNSSLGSITCCKNCERFKSQEILVGVIQTFQSIFLEIQAGDLQRMAIVEANTLIFVMELSAGQNQPLQKAQHWGLFTNLIGTCFVSWGENRANRSMGAGLAP